MGTQDKDLLTPAEVAAHLRVSASTVYGLIHKGKLRGIRTGRGANSAIRVPRSSLEELIAQRNNTHTNTKENTK